MADEYIKREALQKELQEELDFESPMYTADQNKHINIGLKIALRAIKKHTAADVEEVKRGRWVDKWGGIYVNQLYKCSACGEMALGDSKVWFLTDYCPHCGAKMDGGADHE